MQSFSHRFLTEGYVGDLGCECGQILCELHREANRWYLREVDGILDQNDQLHLADATVTHRWLAGTRSVAT